MSYQNQKLTEAELKEIEAVHAEESYANALEIQQRDWAYEMGFDPYPKDPDLKIYKVRFQQINHYEIEVEAINADEADRLALERFKENQSYAQCLQSAFGHMTIEELK